ncbi:MAG: amidohydrolase [Reyranellaceae bacterium]
MPVLPHIAALESQLIGWRRHLHAHPELGYEERLTGDFIAAKLSEMGLDVHRGLGGTGVVGTLRGGNGGETIGIRADIDALPIAEANEFDHRSRHEGRMHACGHDGHTVMALGAASYLAQTRRFSGTVHFVFQPAEEGGAGAAAMIRDGLFDLFPMSALFALHNRPGLAAGRFGICAGYASSASTRFEIEVAGRDAHAAMPQQGVDGLMIGAKMADALLTIAARNVNPADMATIAITDFRAGVGWGVIPGAASIKGGFRSYRPEVQDAIESALRRTVDGIAAAYGAAVTLTTTPGYPSMRNDPALTAFAAETAREVFGADKTDAAAPPSLASEDFSYYADHLPCAYGWIGNGEGVEACAVHNAHYDFNDRIIGLGASYFARLVENRLARVTA